MPNVMITIKSHEMCDNVIVNTKYFTAEMNTLYKQACKNDFKTAFIEGYPDFQCGVPGGVPMESLPCMVDDTFTIHCNL